MSLRPKTKLSGKEINSALKRACNEPEGVPVGDSLPQVDLSGLLGPLGFSLERAEVVGALYLPKFLALAGNYWEWLQEKRIGSFT